MSLRERQKEMTRELIVDALSEVVIEQGPRTFSMEDVADRAEVSLRTLYRYYPGREELLQALVDKLDKTLEGDGQSAALKTLAGSLDHIAARMEFFSEHERLARAALAIVAGTEGISESREDEPALRAVARQRAERHKTLRELVNREFPDLPPTIRAQLFAVVRTLGSMVGWGQMTGPAGGLDGHSAGVATRWALKTLSERAGQLMNEGIENLEDDL